MDNYSDKNRELDTTRMLNHINNHSEIRRLLNESMEKSIDVDEVYREIPYNQKKKKKISKVKVAIATVLLIGSICGVASYVLPDNVAVIGVNSEAKHEIDDKIDYFMNIMGPNASGDDWKFVTIHSHDSLGNPNTSFDTYALANDFVRASQVSETDLRCAVIAAYKLIDQDYKEVKIEEAFRIIANDENLSQAVGNNLDYLRSGSVKVFLETFGYEDFEQYKMNERKNIKKDYAVENYLQDRGRR